MKKNQLYAIITAVVIIPLVTCGILIANHKNGTIEPTAAFRSTNAIITNSIHYFDSEAIALADSSNDTSSLRSEALRAFNLVNEEREKAGLGTLSWDSNLESCSTVRAEEQAISFSHTRPNGTPWYTVNSDIMGGENLAYGYDDTKSVMKGWMESTTHRENILYPEFTKIAISVYVADDGTHYWAQEFGY